MLGGGGGSVANVGLLYICVGDYTLPSDHFVHLSLRVTAGICADQAIPRGPVMPGALMVRSGS